MKILFNLLMFALIGCATNRSPASLPNNQIAHDTMAFGNIKASATKTTQKEDVCFDIHLEMKGVEQKDAASSNWTVAWVDKNSHYHLLVLNQRDPASIPQGGQKLAPYGTYQEWTNTFRTCAPKARFGDVKSLILTPKTLPYRVSDGMNLTWE